MKRILILADDFTGANDTGVQLRRRGIPTDVCFTVPKGVPLPQGLVLDTESRALPPEKAYEAVKNAVAPLDLDTWDCIIKKVDSTLRGRISWEVKALDEAMGADWVIFAPALPDLGRTTVDGVHLLKGVPVASTELSKDPKNPVTEDRIDLLLKEAYQEPIGRISLKELRSGRLPFGESSPSRKTRIFACDAQTNGDLVLLIQAVTALGGKTLWVGAAAIADNLLETDQRSLPSFGVAASLSTVTRRQVARAREDGAAVVALPVDRLLQALERREAYVEEGVALLAECRDVILAPESVCDPEAKERCDKAAGELGLTNEEVGDFIQELVGEIAFRILENSKVAGVFLTGGDTAISLFRQGGAVGSTILGEVATGIPLMQLRGGVLDGLKVITKAGAFGNEDAVAYALRKLKECI